jgi:hypothetical protein
MVMQEEHKGFILVQTENAQRLVWGGDLYYPAPEVLVVEVTSSKRGKGSQVSTLSELCVWWTESWCLSVCALARIRVSPSRMRPCFPFIISRGDMQYMCMCHGITVLVLGVGWSMALYSEGEALHSLCCSRSWPSYGRSCSCSVHAKPYRHCGQDVYTWISHADPCSSSQVDFRGLFPVVRTLGFWWVRGFRSWNRRCPSSLGVIVRTMMATTMGADNIMSDMLYSAWCGHGHADVICVPSTVPPPWCSGEA